MRFSQRQGLKSVKQIQVDDMDDDLRTQLWNVLIDFYWSKDASSFFDDWEETYGYNVKLYPLIKKLWLDYYINPFDTLGVDWDETYSYIKENFSKCPWYEVYDFIEFIAKNDTKSANFMRACNKVLEKNVSGYRFIDGKITQITSQIEIASIEQAIQDSDKFKGASTHLKRALDFLSDRKKPDYRNSIKESISAVESVCKILVKKNKATLGDALKVIEKKHELHTCLRDAFNKLYGYTNDEGGIRHAMLDEPNITFEDAKFMLVSCSTFVNYLTAKSKDSNEPKESN